MSVMPQPSNRMLYAAKNSSIKASTNWILDFEEHLSGTSQSLMFLSQSSYILLFSDLRRRQIIDVTTKLTATGQLRTSNAPTLTTMRTVFEFLNVLQESVCVTRPSKHQEPKHQVQHHLITAGPPGYDQARRLRFAKQEIEICITDGGIRPSKSQYAPVQYVCGKQQQFLTNFLFHAFRTLHTGCMEAIDLERDYTSFGTIRI